MRGIIRTPVVLNCGQICIRNCGGMYCRTNFFVNLPGNYIVIELISKCRQKYDDNFTELYLSVQEIHIIKSEFLFHAVNDINQLDPYILNVLFKE